MENRNFNYQNDFERYRQMENAQDKKLTKVVIILGIGIVLVGFASFFFFMNMIERQADVRWSEAKSAVSVIKRAVDTYSVKNGGDISGLDSPKGTLKEGFVSGSALLNKLNMYDGTFEIFVNFNAEDFSLEFVTDGKDGLYIIKVDASKGNGGISGKGPSEGIGTYNSATNTWGGKFSSFGPAESIPNFIPVNPPSNSLQTQDWKKLTPNFEGKKWLKEPDFKNNDNEMWNEARTAVKRLKIGLDIYKAVSGDDISALNEGNPEHSLLESLRIERTYFMTLKYFDKGDFQFAFETDGTDGDYIIHVDASIDPTGGLTEKGPKSGSGWYQSSDDSWHGKLVK